MFLLPVGEGTFPTIERPSHRPPAALHHGQHPKSAGPGSRWAGPVAIRTAKRFPLQKGGMHFGGCHCHARSERGTGKTINRTPFDTRSVPVTIQQSAVQPILSPVSFRYALIQPSRQENSSDAESRLQGVHFPGGFRD